MNYYSQKGIASIVIALVFAVILVGAVGVYYVKQQQIRKSSIVDETANWKTYKNEKYGFEAKYPKNWVAQDKLPQKPKEAVFSENLEISNNSLPEIPKFILWINPMGFGLLPSDIVYKLASTEEGKLKIINRREIPPKREGMSNIDGHIIINSETFKFGQDRYIFMFDFVQGGENYEPILNQILSTFKFTQ